MTNFPGVLRDQRANSRLQTCLPCEIRLGDASHGAFLLDASLTGALISSSLKPLKGTTISISLEIPGRNKPLLFEGKVVRVTRKSFAEEDLCHIGVRFSRITPDSMILVKALTEERDLWFQTRKVAGQGR